MTTGCSSLCWCLVFSPYTISGNSSLPITLPCATGERLSCALPLFSPRTPTATCSLATKPIVSSPGRKSLFPTPCLALPNFAFAHSSLPTWLAVIASFHSSLPCDSPALASSPRSAGSCLGWLPVCRTPTLVGTPFELGGPLFMLRLVGWMIAFRPLVVGHRRLFTSTFASTRFCCRPCSSRALRSTRCVNDFSFFLDHLPTPPLDLSLGFY